jgi:manganese oxidase
LRFFTLKNCALCAILLFIIKTIMMNNLLHSRHPYALFAAMFGFFLLQNFAATGQNAPAGASGRTIVANVVALDQPFFYNRFGAQQPTGTVFALLGDVVKIDPSKGLVAGNVKLRDSKRPRPIVIRINKGDILEVNFTNMLTPYNPLSALQMNYVDRDTTVKAVNDSMLVGYNTAGQNLESMTRTAAFHPVGLNLVGTIASDGSWVGANDNSQANPNGIPPGSSLTYHFYGAEEGAFLITTGADNIHSGGGFGDNGQASTGLFGGIVVEPEGAEYYRSQVTNEDMALATTRWVDAQGYPSTPDKGLPIINWAATYPSNFWDPSRKGLPILNMLKPASGNNRFELVSTDLTALITGPDHGYFKYDPTDPDYFIVPASPNRTQPFREFVTIYHESPLTVQAFPIQYESDMAGVLGAGNDAFSINYGSGGIGAEIYANRIGVGPAADCLECAYEEFFLSAWATGDPAMVVDVPANTAWKTNSGVPNQPIARMPLDKIGEPGVDKLVLNSLVGQLENAMNVYQIANNNQNPSFAPPQPYTYKASKALYPDDPSNVYHSYLGDHVKFRVLHGGGLQTHVHHQHAHQWLHSPNSDNGHYLDSQVLNPGESYTLEMVYNGSGNRNQTVGDAIFHCHFYPHFAGGMWSMWRVHDVFEAGTKYNSVQNLEIAPGARALPDAEILTGTPIPGLVPLPMLPMAPAPGDVSIDKNGQVVVTDPYTNPGYPFFIAGVAGRRPPHPPLDFAVDTINGHPETLDGGLPRHVIVGGKTLWENHSATDWTKIMGEAVAIQLPEDGTAVEQTAMAAHATRYHPTVTTEGQNRNFIYNGQPAVSGAPFADPAINDQGNPVGQKRIYKAANIQMDAVFNKEGWHFPQQRMITLWGDVSATLDGIRPPEPFFFRANTYEYVEYWHTNLVPEYYELDDYQVRTPTDILGQHIHLVKFDVTSSDGAANGFNYEDGTFSPGTVQERVQAINKAGGIIQYSSKYNGALNNTALYPTTRSTLSLKPPNPVWGQQPADSAWYGAQTTIQRWYADPLMNNHYEDQTLRTVFTHDHFGPSTHQQAGLYAGLLVEPANSTWIDPMTGDTMGQILPNRQPKKRSVPVDGANMWVTDGGPTSYQANVIMPDKNDSYREFALELQDLALAYTAQSISTINPYPELKGVADPFTNPAFQQSVKNYTGWTDNKWVINQNGPALISPGPSGVYSFNYRNEPVPLRVDTKAGATVPGQPGDIAYGFQSRTDRANPNFNNQPRGGSPISTGSSFKFPMNPISAAMGPGDPYTPLLRAYQGDKIQIRTLVGAHLKPHYFNMHGVKWLFEPSNPVSGYRSTQSMGISEHFEMSFQLPTTGKPTNDYLYMPSASLPGMQYGTWGIMRAYDNGNKQDNLLPLPYNVPGSSQRPQGKSCGCPDNAPVKPVTIVAVESTKALKGPLVLNKAQNLNIPNGLFFVRKSDLNPDGTLRANVPIEPLILRFRAGDCIHLTLENQIGQSPEPTDNNLSILNNNLLTLNLNPSSTVGLSPTLLSYDVTESDGTNVGLNPEQTVASGGSSKTYKWYAGKWDRQPDGTAKATPVEFGSVVLQPADPLEQALFGMEAAIIIEPQNATWVEDINSRASATVYDSISRALLFREFVLIYNDMFTGNGSGPVLANYGTEPLLGRFPSNLNNNGNAYQTDMTMAFSNQLAGDPETPIFAVEKGMPVRFHLPTAQGANNGAVFELHGHVWQEEPYINNSTGLGYNSMSEWKGSQGQVGALNSFELLIDKAGGAFEVPGDYIYKSLAGPFTGNGFWGLMRVADRSDVPTVNSISQSGNTWSISGSNTVNFDLSPATSGAAKTNVFSPFVELFDANNNRIGSPVAVNQFTGGWAFNGFSLNMGAQYTVKSTDGKNTVYGTRSLKAGPYGRGTVQAKPLVLATKAKQILGKAKSAKAAAPIYNAHKERLINMDNLPHQNKPAATKKKK